MEKILKARYINSNWVLFAIAMASVILVTGCVANTYTYNGVYALSERDLAERKQAANGGDPQAAFEVYLHYKFGSNNRYPSQTMYWLKKAAALGNETATRHLQSNKQQP